MSIKDTFCPSPWIHMRINNSGSYEYCRWKTHDLGTRVDPEHNIKRQRPVYYFQNGMSEARQTILNGNLPSGCADCMVMERHNKVSGRQRQLLKVGVINNSFEKSLLSSPLRDAFDFSLNNQGYTQRTPSDWQIDLGNYCNGACVFCNPESSSTLATEFKKLGMIDQLPPQAWCDDPVLLETFVQDLASSKNLRYLHFLGGETVITPGFKKILQALIEVNLAQSIVIGFTTNLTVWPDDITNLLVQFQQVNLGMSIETLTPVNDYVRYPSKQHQTKKILDQWVALAKSYNWLIQLRITPTCLTVHELTTVFDYAWANHISVESCNFLSHPECMRIGVLPDAQRRQVFKKLKQWITDHTTDLDQQIINTRDPNLARAQIIQDAKSYLSYLESTSDESYRLPDLVNYLKRLENNRGNSVLDYLPQYENLFRSAGY